VCQINYNPTCIGLMVMWEHNSRNGKCPKVATIVFDQKKNPNTILKFQTLREQGDYAHPEQGMPSKAQKTNIGSYVLRNEDSWGYLKEMN